MTLHTDQIVNSDGAPVPGAQVYVYDSSGTLEALPANPVITDEYGNFSFDAPSGEKLLDIWVGGRRRYRQEIQLGALATADLAENLASAGGATLINFRPIGVVGNGVADDTAALQAAINNVAANGTVYLPAGTYKISAALNIVNPGVKLIGASKKTTIIKQATTSAKILNITGDHCEVSSLGFDYSSTPTSGAVAIYTFGSYGSFSEFFIAKAYVGIEVDQGVSNKFRAFDIRAYVNIGIHLHDMNDAFFSQFVLDAENVTNGAQGGIRLYNKCEAVVFSDGDVIRGAYSLIADASVNTVRLRPGASSFNTVFFDSAKNGALLSKGVDIDFNSCWFSYAGFNDGAAAIASNGIVLGTVDDIRFTGGRSVSNYGHGISVGANAKRVRFSGFTARDNSLHTANTYSGIYFVANTTDFTVSQCSLGASADLYQDGTQKYGCEIASGTSDRYIIADNLVSGNGTGGVSDGGSGANKRVANNY